MNDTDPERRGSGWSEDEEKRLYDAFTGGKTVEECMLLHERNWGGITSRLRRMGLIDSDGKRISPVPEFSITPAMQRRKARKEARAQHSSGQPEAAPPPPELNERFQEALRLMQDTHQNLFITGRAGTGKSTLLSCFCRTTEKQPVVLAPTGVAALNVKGQTIHRFFNFYVDVTPDKIRAKKKVRNPKLYKKLQTIVIDEISMVRADLLDCIDTFLRLHGPDLGKSFGGVQMIFIGDLYQLPPVVTQNEQELFRTHYETPYFFSAHALQDADFRILELEKVYRQKEQGFIDLLNKIRDNSASAADIARINSRLSPAQTPAGGDFHITLTTTNAIADAINDAHLAALKGRLHTAAARVEGDFGKEYYPTATELSFKPGAQIMLLNNDADRRWVNGSIGVISEVKQDEDGRDYLAVQLQEGNRAVEVYPFTWEVYRFGVEDGAITSEPAGTFTQYPFRLAWAITIHKSQGKTFERVVIDIGRGAFAAGQLYVALSRCTSFEGLSLKTPVRAQDIRTDERIVEFLATRRIETLPPAPDTKTLDLIRRAIADKTPLAITYRKADDTEIACNVVPLHIGPAAYQGHNYEGMKAFCADRQAELMFRLDRILAIEKVAS